ncbi:MAG: hypothetical protein NUV80_03420 [Candidatus Berkelbacteria bacterium]|nr:hypothetical protein [Candidatus Berkelbacteria bacterium]MCR4307585.1 hypothetical protein [Candidatus Berkelbacteria bacterium]
MQQNIRVTEGSPQLKMWRLGFWGGLLLFVLGVILFSIPCFAQSGKLFEDFFPPGCLLMAFGGLGLAYASQVDRPKS